MTIRIGNAPCSWGVEFANDPRNPGWRDVLRDCAAAGYKGIELGPVGFMPEDPKLLGEALDEHGLQLIGGVVFRPFHDPDAWDEVLDAAHRTCRALKAHGAPLLSQVPGDIATWCPGYVQASEDERAAFWAGMLSALAKHESTWNPAAVGGGGKWFGLVQIAPATARSYGCAAGSGSALKDGVANLSCAVRIAARTVRRDGVVAAGMRGLAADWGPFHSARKRNEMAARTRSQSYCQPRQSAQAGDPAKAG